VRGKYSLLGEYLRLKDEKNLILTIEEIEKIIDDKLPKSALVYPEWWANDKTHIQGRCWLSVGYKTCEIRLGKEVKFIKV
jgi:hypothetical protein